MDKISEVREDLLASARALIGSDSLPRSASNETGTCDSAAFVRQVLHKLGGPWGPRSLKWNQAFLYDHLQGEIAINQAKPGDLVFWSGSYWNSRKQLPPHGILHVEIATGAGEGTIGVRSKKIEEYDRLIFPSLRFRDLRVHCKSIDPWLRGQFKCFCSKHNWTARGNETLRQEFEDPFHEMLRLWKNFALGTGNNNRLVKQALLEHGWKQVVVSSSKLFRLSWTQTMKETAKLNIQEGRQLSNHVPGLHNVFTSKRALAHLVHKIPHFPAPKGYDLADEADYQTFVSVATDGVWILKPHALNQGIGISLVRNVMEFKRKLAKGEESRQKVIQVYLEPLLLDGYKFDIRFYTAIVRCRPFVAVWYPEYYVRRSLIKYESDSLDLLAHLTNAHQQKAHPDFEARKEESIISRAQVAEKLGPVVTERLEQEMVRCSAALFKAAATEVDQRWGCFELIGLDYMLDAQGNVNFIEANTNPALFTDTSVQQALIPRVVAELVQIVLRIHEDDLDFLEGTHFRLLYSEISVS